MLLTKEIRSIPTRR